MENGRIVRLVRGEYVLFDPAAGEDGVLAHGAVAVKADGKVASVGPYRQLRQEYPDVPVEGDDQCLVMPGMIDSHSHGSGLSYFELGPGYDHLEYWKTITPTISRPDPYLDTLWCAVKHIRSGCTAIHHMGGMKGVDRVLSAYQKAGMRWAFSATIQDANLLTYDDNAFFPSLPPDLRERAEARYRPEDPGGFIRQYFEEFRALCAEHAKTAPIGLGPMGPQWCSGELLKAMREVAGELDAKIHMHAVQTPYQNDSIVRTHGQTSIAYLDQLELLGPHLTIGHGVWMSERDIALLAEAGASVTHHPGCNLNMRNGILPLKAILAAGITVAVAIDGKGINDDEDIIAEMRLAEKLHRVADLQPGTPRAVTPAMLVEMTTTNAARIVGWEDVCGRLQPGLAADLAVVDLAPDPYVHPEATPQERLVMQKSRHDVRLVMVEGQVLMRDGNMLTIDEEALKHELVHSLTASSSQGEAELLEQLRPHILRHYQDLAPIPEAFRPFYPLNRRDWTP